MGRKARRPRASAAGPRTVSAGGLVMEVVRDPEPGSMLAVARVELASAPAVNGAVVRRCTGCDHDVWVSPSGLRNLAERALVLVCEECVRVRTEKEGGASFRVTEESLHEATLQELKAILRERLG